VIYLNCTMIHGLKILNLKLFFILRSVQITNIDLENFFNCYILCYIQQQLALTGSRRNVCVLWTIGMCLTDCALWSCDLDQSGICVNSRDDTVNTQIARLTFQLSSSKPSANVNGVFVLNLDMTFSNVNTQLNVYFHVAEIYKEYSRRSTVI
jgi:hypothetical protein